MGGGTITYGTVVKKTPEQEYHSKYYQKRRDILLAKQKQYYIDHREDIIEYQRQYTKNKRAMENAVVKK